MHNMSRHIKKAWEVSNLMARNTFAEAFFFFVHCISLIPNIKYTINMEKCKNFSGSSTGMTYIWGIPKNWYNDELCHDWNLTTFWSVFQLSSPQWSFLHDPVTQPDTCKVFNTIIRVSSSCFLSMPAWLMTIKGDLTKPHSASTTPHLKDSSPPPLSLHHTGFRFLDFNHSIHQEAILNMISFHLLDSIFLSNIDTDGLLLVHPQPNNSMGLYNAWSFMISGGPIDQTLIGLPWWQSTQTSPLHLWHIVPLLYGCWSCQAVPWLKLYGSSSQYGGHCPLALVLYLGQSLNALSSSHIDNMSECLYGIMFT